MLQLLVEGERACQKTRAGAARTEVPERGAGCLFETRILGEPQVVVGAGDDHLLAIYHNGAAFLFGDRLEVGVYTYSHRLVDPGKGKRREGFFEDVTGERLIVFRLLRQALADTVEVYVIRQVIPP